MAVKEERVAVRVTPQEKALIAQAAEAEETTVTAFIVSASTARARDALADRRAFFLGDVQWADFNAALDRPVEPKPALAALFAEPSIFE